MDEIQAVCTRYSVPIIEDAAQAIGAEYPSKDGTKRAEVNRGLRVFELLSDQEPGCVRRCRHGNHRARMDGPSPEGSPKSWDGKKIRA